MWKKTQWLDGGTDPVTTYTYDPYGNIATIKDAKNNTSTITYDSTYTYPTTLTNPLWHTVQKTYDYGFGKPLTETDPNNNTTTYEYDEFGRTKKITKPLPYAKTEYKYQNYGDPYAQNVREEAQNSSGTLIHFKETYFDGLGRTTYEAQGGLDAGTIMISTEYNNKGLVWKKSYPYYSGDTAHEITYIYDAVDRPERTLNPDGTSSSISYDRARTMYIDANGHKKVAVKDVYDRIVSVEEYTGNSPSTYELYATTAYEYDVLNNLTRVTDANGNQTTMTYDSLSRKTVMDDPDMGHWTYQYDANGNLISQTDAKGQTITFTYDALNRVTLKNYPTGTDITYAYDETFASHPKGRLTTLTDNSGMTKFSYDEIGQITETVKTIASDQSTYTTLTQYDPIGRVKKIIYPDSTEVDYTYDGNGNVKDIRSEAQTYVTYNSYNALGNPLLITYGNGVTTTYQYHPENNRLFSITTNKQTTAHMNLSYYYDSAGNITKITDHLDGTKSRTYKYDDLDRLIEADSQSYGGMLLYQYDKIGNMTYNCKYGYYFYDDPEHVHAVTKVKKADGTLIDSYSYDANGNMISGAGRELTYDYGNRPVSITYNGNAVVNVYDASGNRVQKMISSPSQDLTAYIGQLYECNSSTGECTKYVFAGTKRIANIKGAETYYYHTDHLESSSIITDSTGGKVEDIYYYPYGEMQTNTGSINVRHKYTGKEYDAETGLYYFGARYYDPRLARFISADSIVPLPLYPQSYNRYSYAYNNPVVLRDLNGHAPNSLKTNEEIAQAVKQDGIKDYTGDAVKKGQANAKETNEKRKGRISNRVDEDHIVEMIADGRFEDIEEGGGDQSEAEINLLAQLIYAEAAGEYKTENAMEAVGWVVRNRLEKGRRWDFPDRSSYEAIIKQKGQFTSIGGDRWNEFSDPAALNKKSCAAYERALTVAKGVYDGSITDPTGGAVFFHSGTLPPSGHQDMIDRGTIIQAHDPIGRHTFYKYK